MDRKQTNMSKHVVNNGRPPVIQTHFVIEISITVIRHQTSCLKQMFRLMPRSNSYIISSSSRRLMLGVWGSLRRPRCVCRRPEASRRKKCCSTSFALAEDIACSIPLKHELVITLYLLPFVTIFAYVGTLPRSWTFPFSTLCYAHRRRII